MSDSILTSTKKMLGIEETDTAFDVDIITHINSIFSILNQLGIGPAAGFMIEDKEPVWSEFLADDLRLNSVKTYMYLRVRILFDPPATSFLVTSLNERVQELEWRINCYREEESWVDPNPIVVAEEV